MFETIINTINGLLWGHILIYLLVGAGLLFTLATGLLQLRGIGHGFKLLFTEKQHCDKGLTPFQVFCTSMAARVGTGNMAGVAMAIFVGGPGAVFWMWIIALLGMSTSMIESTLAQLYKEKDAEGNFRGGPAYYMERALGQKWMGVLFSLLLIIAFGLVFNAVQANTISDALNVAVGIAPEYMAVFIATATAMVIWGGLNKVAKISTLLVPFMAVAYIGIAVVVMLMNIEKLPAVFELIISSAFGFEQAAVGGVAYTMAQAMQSGIARGLFSNEAGMGSAANIAASAQAKHPASQGFVQMVGVFMDTIIICSATAFLVLLSGALESGQQGGIALTQMAVTEHVGSWGAGFIAIVILLFCFTSIIANYSYAETNVMFLFKGKAKPLLVFRLMVIGMVIFGSIASVPVVWNLADASMGMMATVNLVAIIILAPIALSLIKDYYKQIKSGKEVTFNASKFPKIKGQISKDVWQD